MKKKRSYAKNSESRVVLYVVDCLGEFILTRKTLKVTESLLAVILLAYEVTGNNSSQNMAQRLKQTNF